MLYLEYAGFPDTASHCNLLIKQNQNKRNDFVYVLFIKMAECTVKNIKDLFTKGWLDYEHSAIIILLDVSWEMIQNDSERRLQFKM